MRPIVVGVDGSEHGARALRWAAEEARLRGTSLIAVHAWRYPYPSVELIPPLPMEQAEADAHTVLRHALKDEADALDGVLVEERVVYGEPGAALVAIAPEAEMVVVGSRGRGGLAGVLLGSVGQHVSHRAPCAVVIVR